MDQGASCSIFFSTGDIHVFRIDFPILLFITQDNVSGQVLSLYLGKLGAYSPVLAGMFVSRLIHL